MTGRRPNEETEEKGKMKNSQTTTYTSEKAATKREESRRPKLKIDPDKLTAYIKDQIKREEETIALFFQGRNAENAAERKATLERLLSEIEKDRFAYGD